MAKLSSRRVLIAGFLSPIAAFFCYVLVYLVLERISSDLEKDWLLRLSLCALAAPELSAIRTKSITRISDSIGLHSAGSLRRLEPPPGQYQQLV